MPNMTRKKQKNAEDKTEATSNEKSATPQNAKVDDDDANKQVEQKTDTDVINKKSPAIVNLAADLSKVFITLLIIIYILQYEQC